MKNTYLFILTIFLASCSSKKVKIVNQKAAVTYANIINRNQLKALLYTYASNKFKGRKTGSMGQKEAALFLKSYYLENNISSPLGNNTYYQNIPQEYFNGQSASNSQNVLAFIKGSEKPEEVVIISAHLDHLGVSKNGEIYNGADDDGSGTVAILQIAKAFNIATQNGFRPKRSIMFLHLTGEEIGLYGSRYYTQKSPVFKLKNTVANLNIDMIGRVDDTHKNNRNYLYLIGSNRLSKDLHETSIMVNKHLTKIDLDYKYNKKQDTNRFYYRSDHYNFAKKNIPVIFYFNGLHEDYHKETDTPDKIEYDLLENRTKLIFYTAWQLANMKDRIKLN